MPSVTLNYTPAAAARIKAALEYGLPQHGADDLPREANDEDLKNFLDGELRRFVRDIEKQQARDAADAAVTDIETS